MNQPKKKKKERVHFKGLVSRPNNLNEISPINEKSLLIIHPNFLLL